MQPAEILRIRTKLGLTQQQAGLLLGGGQSAFTKYEAGVHQPSKAARQLLRLLDTQPELLYALEKE